MSQTSAAIKLQYTWRRRFSQRTTPIVVNKHLTTGASIEYVKSITFDTLVTKLRERPIIEMAQAALHRVHKLTTRRHGSPINFPVNVRVFLAGFMIAYRPTHVFENMGTLETALIEATTPLLTQFEAICKSILDTGSFRNVPHALTRSFPTALYEFLKRFKAWKVPDEQKLTMRIRHALMALYQAQEHLPPHESEDSVVRTEFRTQIQRLRSKLQQIAGIDALNAFDEQHRTSATTGATTASTGTAYGALPGRLSNEHLAHELLMDPAFQLNDEGGCTSENPVFRRIRESFHQAFWDSLADDLRLLEPCFVRVLRVLGEIRDGVNELAGSRESGSISEAVDLDFIKQQAEAGLYGWDSFQSLVATIVAIILRVQAPKRDTETKAKWEDVRQLMETTDNQPRALCKALEFLLDRVNIMRIDAANARLRLIAPVIKDHGIDYERGKFEDKLRDGSVTLERTTAWIQSAVKALVNDRADALDGLLDGRHATFYEAHCEAMLSIVTTAFPVRLDTLPETLSMDVHRLQTMQTEFNYLTAATTTVAVVISETRPTMQVIGNVSEILAEAVDMDAAVESIAERHIPEPLRAKTRKAIEHCLAPTSPARKLIHLRLRKALRHMVLNKTAPPADIKREVRLLLPRLERLARKLTRLCELNRTVHLSTYNRLIGEAARQ